MVSFVSSIMVFALGIFLFLRFNYIGDKLNLESSHEFYRFLNDQFLFFVTGVFGIFLLTCMVMTAIVIFFSHRVAGPLFRLSNELKKISKLKSLEELDNVKEIHFRSKDFYQELADEYNQGISNLKTISKENDSVSDQQSSITHKIVSL
jgi:nitrogen fixation/metabolism regulation signal transduction histidine kinase